LVGRAGDRRGLVRRGLAATPLPGGRFARIGGVGRERAMALYLDAAMVDAYELAFARTFGHPFPGSD
jgi:hypothetical protein